MRGESPTSLAVRRSISGSPRLAASIGPTGPPCALSRPGDFSKRRSRSGREEGRGFFWDVALLLQQSVLPAKPLQLGMNIAICIGDLFPVTIMAQPPRQGGKPDTQIFGKLPSAPAAGQRRAHRFTPKFRRRSASS